MAKRGCLSYPDLNLLERKVDQYFALVDYATNPWSGANVSLEVKKTGSLSIPSMSGLAHYLGVDRRTLARWLSGTNPERTYLIALAKSRIEAETERALYDRRTYRGAVFSLLNNFGWKKCSRNVPLDDTHASFTIRTVEPPLRNDLPTKFK